MRTNQAVERPLSETEALRELRQALHLAVPVQPPAQVARRRREVVARIDDQIALAREARRSGAARKKWARVCLSFAAAAAVLAALFLGSSRLASRSDQTDSSASGPPVKINAHAGSDRATGSDPSDQTAGSKLSGSGARLHSHTLALPGSTQIYVSAGTQVSVLDESIPHQIVKLGSGTVVVDVPPKAVPGPRSVEVLTPDVRVEVKGTRFEVAVLDPEDEDFPGTRVTVQRGLVVVHHGGGTLTLRAGESWTSSKKNLPRKTTSKGDLSSGGQHPERTASASSSKAQPPKEQPSTGVASSTSAEPAARAESSTNGGPASAVSASSALATSTVTSSSLPSSSLPSSSLARQNALLESALTSERRGEDQRALALIATLLAEHPETPLRDSALVLKKRILDRSH